MKPIIFGGIAALALCLAGCDATTALTQAKTDIATAEKAVAVGSVAVCSVLPALQADADAVIAITGVDAKTAGDVAAGKAAAAVVCANPTSTNMAALAAKVAAAKVSVNAALSASK